MNTKNNYNNKNNSITSETLDLELLQQKYNNTFIKYKQSVTDYVNYLNNQHDLDKKMVSVKGQSFIGLNTLSQINNTTLNECKAMCSTNQKCSGATFKSNTCILKTGDTNIILASNDTYAIIPEGKQILLNMEDLNQQLIDINKQITEKNNKIKPIYNKIVDDSKNKTIDIINNYKNLLIERQNIIKLLDEYQDLDDTSKEYEIKITQNYYIYILYCILTIFIIFLLYKISFVNVFTSGNTQYGYRS